MPVPDFSPGEVLTAAAMDSIGLWLVKTQTVGTGVSSVIVTDAFSSTYDNYIVTLENVAFSSSSDSLTLQMRSGSTTAVTDYYAALIYAVWGGSIAVATSNNILYWNNVGRGLSATDKNSVTVNIRAPFLSQKTTFDSFVTGADLTGSCSGFHNTVASYNQCVFTTLFGTMTGGTIRVYGLRK